MYTFFNYLKKFESKITESEVPEIQFLNLDIYKNENFNLNSSVGVIVSKLSDTNYLINHLCLSKDNLKNEIVEQINSNFNNYVVLISKLQAIDFLVDNIDKPLQNIKQRLINEVNNIETYIAELKDVIHFLKENEFQTKIVKISLDFYNTYQESKMLSKMIEKKNDNCKFIQKIITSHPENYFLNGNNYDTLKSFLIDFFRFSLTSKKLYNLYDKYLKDEIYSHMISEVRGEEIQFLLQAEDLLKILIVEFYTKTYTKNYILMKNLINLVFSIYLKSNNSSLLFTKILEFGLSEEISNIFENSNNTIISKIQLVQNIYDTKYKILIDMLFKNADKTQTDCIRNDSFMSLFIIPVIEKLNTDKYIFNCVDPLMFKDNFNSVNNFISKNLIEAGLQTENISEIPKFNNNENVHKVKTFLHSFSFFTYFQYLQNEITKLLLDYQNSEQSANIEEINDSTKLDSYISQILIRNSNLLFNYTKTLGDIFKEKKILLKSLPNYLNFIMQSIKFIVLKQKYFFIDEMFLQFLNLINSSSLEGSLNDKTKKTFAEYLNNLNIFISFFSDMQEHSFYSEIIKLVKMDIFIIGDLENKNKLLRAISSNKDLMINNVLNSLELKVEGSFLHSIVKCQEAGHLPTIR